MHLIKMAVTSTEGGSSLSLRSIHKKRLLHLFLPIYKKEVNKTMLVNLFTHTSKCFKIYLARLTYNGYSYSPAGCQHCVEIHR